MVPEALTGTTADKACRKDPGGISEAKKIAAMAEPHLIKTLLHNPLGPVSTAASLHIDLACDNAGPQEVLFPPTVLPDVTQCDFSLKRRMNHAQGKAPSEPGRRENPSDDHTPQGTASKESSRPTNCQPPATPSREGNTD